MKKLVAIIISICMILSFGSYLTADEIIPSLSHSTVYSWDPSTMENYNCYAYVLGLQSTAIPGNFNSTISYNPFEDVYYLEQVIKADLKGTLGFKCVKTTTGASPTSIGIWENIIAMRKEIYCNIDSDFHVAKLTSEGWLHKPGTTAVLKFNNAPSDDVDWICEYFNGVYKKSNVIYDSPILYMSYKRNHGNSPYTWTGTHYHSGTSHFYLYANICADCDGRENATWVESPCTGPTCNLPWSVNPDPITE